ncbi:MAG: preprotein translocase subunit SecG [Candidatus Omnitrophica bacterium]|nr:preprotein translocase subunit SecG [Candidatus Omnitrophota bacterium]
MGFLNFLHVFVAVILIIAILMQAGRGGGLAEGFSSAENLLGPQTNKLMVKVTAVLAVAFFSMALLLAVLNARKEHSLMADLPDVRHKTVVNVEKLFDQPATQTITLNAAEPTEKPAAAK